MKKTVIPKVFIDNPAHQSTKNLYNEKTLEYIRSTTVSMPYPFPYGFFLGTTSGDGDNLDCFVITRKPLRQAQQVAVVPIAVMEVLENGETDHKILARLDGEDETIELNQETKRILIEFIKGVFSHLPAKHMEIGRFLGRDAALEMIARSLDKDDVLPEDAHYDRV